MADDDLSEYAGDGFENVNSDDVEIDVAAAKARHCLSDLVFSRVTDLTLSKNGRHWIGCCPFHDERTPSFAVYDDEDNPHYHCYGCRANGDIIDWVAFDQGWDVQKDFGKILQWLVETEPIRTSELPRRSKAELAALAARNREIALNLWEAARPYPRKAIERWLDVRCGLKLPPNPILRWHPGSARYRSSIMALMTDPTSWQPTGIHQTFPALDGSRTAERKMLGSQGVVQLAPLVDGQVAIAEGIEKAIAIMQKFVGGPTSVWSVCNAGGMASFPLMEGRRLTVFSDNDDAGKEAAQEVAYRWRSAGLEAIIYYPPPEDDDWEDTARRLKL
jgi:DNA primase